MLYTRRDVGKIALASLPMASALAAPNSKINGVQIGAITYSFRSIPDVDQILKAYVDIGLSECELMSNHAESVAGWAPEGRGPGGPGGQGKGPAGGQGKKGGGGGSGGGQQQRVARPPMTEEQITAARERNKEMREWRK